MSIHSGPAKWWTTNKKEGREHIAKKGIVQSGLVLSLDAGVITSYTGSGTTYTSLINSYSCTLTNGASYSSNFSGVITLDGVDDYILTPQIIGTGTSTYSQSYCVWVRPNDTDGNILSMSSVNPQGSWNMPPITAFGSKFRCRTYNANFLDSINTYTNGNWYYVCLIFSYNVTQANAFQRLYVNGVLQAEQTNITYAGSGANNYMFFGQQNPGVDNRGMFAGDIGPIQIYTNKALTEKEVKQNFNALKGRFNL